MLDIAAATEFLAIPDFLKATPAEERGERFVYVQASDESRDYQGETILAKALEESANYYLKFGNLDLDHITQIGPKAGIPNYPLFEIGRPVEVNVQGRRTFVKGQIYRGEGPVAEKANAFWESLTRVTPPQRWYPSVGGAVVSKDSEIDPKTKGRHTVIRAVRWTNIGFSKTPVNLSVPTVSTVPMEAFAKSWGPGGLDLTKALEAGPPVTDAAAKTGGGALARQSLDRGVHSYFAFREKLADAVARGRVRFSPHDLTIFGVRSGLDEHEAAEFAERFVRDLDRHASSSSKRKH